MKRLYKLDYWFPLVLSLLLFAILLVVCYAVYAAELTEEIVKLKAIIEELEKTRIVISR